MLNSEQMLPARVRRMRQMQELLEVEDIILTELEGMISEMYQRAEYLHEELVNEAWLEDRIQSITGGTVEVTARKDSLLVEVVINKGDLSGAESNPVTEFLNKWLPAHLAYEITYEKLLGAVNRHRVIWQDDEILMLRQVVI